MIAFARSTAAENRMSRGHWAAWAAADELFCTKLTKRPNLLFAVFLCKLMEICCSSAWRFADFYGDPVEVRKGGTVLQELVSFKFYFGDLIPFLKHLSSRLLC